MDLLLLLLLLMCTGVDRVTSRRSKNDSRATCNPSNELPIGVQLCLIESRTKRTAFAIKYQLAMCS